MSASRQVSGRDAVTALSRVGFEQVSQRGSHVKLRNATGRVVIVPLHRELAPGTLGSILRQAGLERSQFNDLLG
ncbi:MAG: type II toxin-antitoxin system HicA family toxin [Ilumatobacteraceae bacterium]|nr:type II toxin-antitoxin system HicA family toxin [Ilumatobacteraceae bacterium]